MARTLHTRKRSRPFNVGGRRFKRRRVLRRRRGGVFTTNSRSLRPSSVFAFRARRLRKRSLRSLLWRQTLPLTHFRSIRSQNAALTGPPTQNSANVVRLEALSSADNSEFWRTGGGLEDNNWNDPPPWSISGTNAPASIVIRGGRLWFSASLFGDVTDNVRVRVQLIFVKGQTRNVDDTATSDTTGGWLNAITSAQKAIGWNVMDAPDSDSHLYKPVVDRTFILKTGDTQDIYWKLKPTKIDTAAFQRGANPWFPLWFVYVSGVAGDAIGDIVNIQLGHNLSFAIGATL